MIVHQPRGVFASTAMSSDSVMMTSDTGSTTASRIIVTSGTSVQSATTTPHGPTAAGSTSAAASATPPSGQNRAIGFSVSQFAVGVGAVAGVQYVCCDAVETIREV